MKEVVIVGGGFAGIAAGIALKKHRKDLAAKITLIDKNSFHLFTPSLYEVATSEEPQGNVAIPFTEIFEGYVTCIKGTVDIIDFAKNTVKLTNGQQKKYDYLIVTLGSEPAYFSIPGLKEYSIPLKNLSDALKIKNTIKSMCCTGKTCEKKVRVVIGGGGFSGTELAAELLTYQNKLAKQFALSPDCLEIMIIQGSHVLLKELNQHVSRIAQQRISKPNVTVCFGEHITNVTDKKIQTDTDKSYSYDLFVWTGGVKANSIAQKSGLSVSKKGNITVNQYLQTENYANVLTAGDITGFIDAKTQKPLPTVAQIAEEQGAIVGENVYRIIAGKPLKPYHFRHFGYVVPLGRHYAAAELMNHFHIDGFSGWLLQQAVFLWYLLGILPFSKAFMKWNRFEKDLSQ